MEREKLARQLHNLSKVSLEECSIFAALFEPLSLSKGKLINIDQKNSRSIFFLAAGLLHHYLIAQDDGKRKNTFAIYQPSDIFVTIETPEFNLQGLEVIEPALLFTTSYQTLAIKVAKHSGLLKIYQNILGMQLRRTFAHVHLLQNQTATERYHNLIKDYGKHLYMIPQQYQASLIGISRKHLHRIASSMLKIRKPLILESHESN